MTIVIKTQNGDLVFNPKQVYREMGMIHDPKNFLNDKPAPTSKIYCDDMPIGEYVTAGRAQQVINEYFIFLQSNEDVRQWDRDEAQFFDAPKQLLTYEMPKE